MSEALTYDAWRAKGRTVRRGEKSAQRNEAGQALFTLPQTDRLSRGRFDGGRFGHNDEDDGFDGAMFGGWGPDELNPNEGSK